MTNVTSIIGSIPGVVTPAAPVVSPAASAPGTVKFAPQSTNPTFTERTVDDPLAGVVITQYLNSQDQVVTQVPPSAVVAYLQDGLTADGEVKAALGQAASKIA